LSLPPQTENPCQVQGFFDKINHYSGGT